MTDLDARIRATMASVFGVEESMIGDDSGPDAIPGWDSIHHVHLIVALEAELGVSFDPGDAVDFTSLSRIREAIVEMQR